MKKKNISLKSLKKDWERNKKEVDYRIFYRLNKLYLKEDLPKMSQKDANKMVSKKYQNISMKKQINKSALYCGAVKF